MKAFKVTITVKENQRMPSIERLEWYNMTFEQLKKWNWYFEYRAALLKVKYPRMDVRKEHSQHEPEGVNAAVLKRRQLASGKAQVTKAKNRLAEWIEIQRKNDSLGLFDATQDPNYIRQMEKVKRKEEELRVLEQSLNSG